MKLKYNIPEFKSDIKLSTYLEVQNLIKEDATDDKIVCKIIGVEYHFLKYFPAGEFDKIKMQVLDILNKQEGITMRFKLEGIEYGFIPNLEKITVGEFADLETLFNDPVENAYSLMRVMFRPIVNKRKDTYSIESYNSNTDSSIFKNAPCNVYDSAVVFFLNLKTQLQSVILKSMEGEQEQIKADNTLRNGGGIKLSTL